MTTPNSERAQNYSCNGRVSSHFRNRCNAPQQLTRLKRSEGIVLARLAAGHQRCVGARRLAPVMGLAPRGSAARLTTTLRGVPPPRAGPWSRILLAPALREGIRRTADGGRRGERWNAAKMTTSEPATSDWGPCARTTRQRGFPGRDRTCMPRASVPPICPGRRESTRRRRS